MAVLLRISKHRIIASRRTTRPRRTGETGKRNHATHASTRTGIRGRSAWCRVCWRADVRRLARGHFQMRDRLGPDGDRRDAAAIRRPSLSAAERRTGLRRRERFFGRAGLRLHVAAPRLHVLPLPMVLAAAFLDRFLSGVRRSLSSFPSLSQLRPLP
jgi:hypothetical protein